jgi:hypothetical protein
MAQIAWTTLQIPGSLAVTGIPADSEGPESTSAGKCPRCERWRWEAQCPGITGTVNHLGS